MNILESKMMDAKTLKPNKYDEIMNSLDYTAEPKLDGVRIKCLLSTRTDQKNTSITRGEQDKTSHLHRIANLVVPISLDRTLIDCELTLEGHTSSELAGLLNRDIISPKLNNCELNVFDLLFFSGRDLRNLTLQTRRNFLEQIWKFPLPIKPVYWSEGDKKVKELLYYNILSMGGEGIMIKNLDSRYKSDKRPEKHWYKLKKEETHDVVIMGYTAGTGKYEGLLGALVYGKYRNGKLTILGKCSGMSDAYREYMTKNFEQFKDKVMEIEGMETFQETGALRHPRFIRMREDKKPEECVWEEL